MTTRRKALDWICSNLKGWPSTVDNRVAPDSWTWIENEGEIALESSGDLISLDDVKSFKSKKDDTSHDDPPGESRKAEPIEALSTLVESAKEIKSAKAELVANMLSSPGKLNPLNLSQLIGIIASEENPPSLVDVLIKLKTEISN